MGRFECNCPAAWNGQQCESYDPRFPGGIGRKAAPNGISDELLRDKIQCASQGCHDKAGNGICDEDCNTPGCDFDGGDCSLGVPSPWANCTAPVRCWELFKNKICDEECNNPECLFDGHDCDERGDVQPCNPIYDAYCQSHYANGKCDYGCNTAECNWDGLDCEQEPSILAMGSVSMVLEMDLLTFRNMSVAFVRSIGRQLRTTVRIKLDPMVIILFKYFLLQLYFNVNIFRATKWCIRGIWVMIHRKRLHSDLLTFIRTELAE